jgi:hypothetical protein
MFSASSVIFSAPPRGASVEQSDTKFFIAAAVAVFLFYYSYLLWFAPELLLDPDTLWHIVTGQWILDHRQFPTVDFYSYTNLGKPWISSEWLAETFYATAYKLAGWRGVTILASASCSAIIAIVCFYLLRHLRFSVAVGLTALTEAAVSSHFIARPHIYSYILLAIWTIALLDAYDDEKFDLPSPFVLSPLMILWANLHGSFTFGLLLLYVFAAFCLYHAFIKHDYAKFRWLAIAVLIVSVSALLTPYGIEPAFMTTKLMGMKSLHNIMEWGPPDFQRRPLLLIFLIAILLAMAGLGIRFRGPRLVVFALIAFVGFRYIRALHMFFVLMPIIIARPAAERLRFIAPQLSATQKLEGEEIADPVLNFLQRRSTAILAGFAALAILSTASAWWREDIVPPKQNMPEAAIDFVKRANISGNVFNSYQFGGYLIFSGIPTFIDGRAELFGDTFLQKYKDAVELHDIRGAFEMLDEYKVNWIIMAPKEPLAIALAQRADWDQVFADEYSVVFERHR